MADPMASFCDLLNRLLACHHPPVEIEPRGKSLVLWAKLPPKQGRGNHVKQRITLGIKANEPGLRDAMEAAMELQGRLVDGSFQWREYDKNYYSVEATEKMVAEFKNEFLNKPNAKAKPSSVKSTWRCAYQPYLNRLIKIQQEDGLPFAPDLFVKALESYDPCSSSREKCSICLKRLAKYTNITLPDNWTELSTGYQSLTKGKLKYPQDDEIVQLIDKFHTPEWRWVYGMMATYGLRPHEVFHCDFDESGDGTNKVTVRGETKTGFRTAFPLLPKWVEQFDLRNVRKPNIKLDRELGLISNNVNRQFRNCGIGYIPYSLRHAFAIRTIHHGFNPSLAAKMMGHSLEKHSKVYHFYMNEKDLVRGYKDSIKA